MAAVGELSMRVTRGDHRPWSEKWHTVLHALDHVDEIYSGEAHLLGSIEIDRRVTTFFVECDHLRDWMKGDAATFSDLDSEDIDEYRPLSRPLVI